MRTDHLHDIAMRIFFLAVGDRGARGMLGGSAVGAESASGCRGASIRSRTRSALRSKRSRWSRARSFKGNPSPYTALGATQGYCFHQSNSSGGQVIHGDGIRAAAYRKYGDQVDAVVEHARVVCTRTTHGAVFEPYTENGYFRVRWYGGALHWGESAAASPAAGSH